MTGWLFDTSVLSALAPGRPPIGERLTTWLRAHENGLYISAITAVEVEAGFAKLRRQGAVARAQLLEGWFSAIVSAHRDRLLPLDMAAGREAGALSDLALAKGRHPGFADVAIAAIASVRGLAVLTANLRHFEPLGVPAFDPFDPAFPLTDI